MSEEPPLPETQPERGSLGLILDRNFGPHFAGLVASALGVWINNLVAAVVVFQLTGSALLTGAVSMAQFVPQLLLGPFSGALADRGDRVRQFVLGRMTSATGAGVLAVWVAVVGVDGLPGPAPVIGATLIVGIGFAVGAPALQALVPALVRPSELGNAVALNQVPHTLARAVGPALGALILATAGAAPAFAVAAVANAVHGGIVSRLTLRRIERRATDGSVRTGLRYLRIDPACGLLLAGIATVGVGMDPLITLMPPLAEQLGGTPALVGWLVSAFGLGSTMVVILLGPARRRIGIKRMNPIGLMVFAAAYVLVVLASSSQVALGALLLAGIGYMLAMTSLTTQLQSRLPEELRGRIMALWGVAYLGARPVGAVINGLVADFVSLDAAFLLMAAILVVGALVARPSRTNLTIPRLG